MPQSPDWDSVNPFAVTARRAAQEVFTQLYGFDNNKQAYVAKYNIMYLSRIEVHEIIDKAIRKVVP